jgi:drug/metabolite transporter (DMT)-like permease
MSFDLSRLRRGEWTVGAGSVVLLASMLFLPWYGDSRTIDGWNALNHFRWLVVVTLIASGALLFFAATRRAPAVPVTVSLFVSVLGAACTAWLLYRVAIDPVAGRKLGGWVGLAGAAAITYGGFSATRREGIAPQDAPAEIPTVEPWAQSGS